MHWTETKHGLIPGPPSWRLRYSNLFLWIDRIVAVSVSIYGVFWGAIPWFEGHYLVTAILLLTVMMMGEACTENMQWQYVAFHLIWHAGAYYFLSLL